MSKGLFTLWNPQQKLKFWTYTGMNGPPCWPASAHIVETRRKGRIQAVSGSELSSAAKTKNGRVSQEKATYCWAGKFRLVFFFHLQCVLYCPNIFAVIGAKNNRSRGKNRAGSLNLKLRRSGGKKKEKGSRTNSEAPYRHAVRARRAVPSLSILPPLYLFLEFSVYATSPCFAVSKVGCLMAEREREKHPPIVLP